MPMSEYKRDHPRIKKNLPVEIVAPGEKTLFATTYDVSKRGVQLLCDGITVREIFGGPGLSRPAKPPSVLMKLRLTHSGQEPEQIEAECRAVFSRRGHTASPPTGISRTAPSKSASSSTDHRLRASGDIGSSHLRDARNSTTSILLMIPATAPSEITTATLF